MLNERELLILIHFAHRGIQAAPLSPDEISLFLKKNKRGKERVLFIVGDIVLGLECFQGSLLLFEILLAQLGLLELMIDEDEVAPRDVEASQVLAGVFGVVDVLVHNKRCSLGVLCCSSAYFRVGVRESATHIRSK